MLTSITTERLQLVQPGPDHVEPWMAFFTSDRARWIGGGTKIDRPSAWRVFASVIGHWSLRGWGTFVITDRDSGATLGGVGPWFPLGKPEKEIGWTLWSPEHEGRGIAREAAQATLTHAFRDLGWDTAVSYIHRDNAPSIALARRLGATHDAAAACLLPEDVVYRHSRGDHL